MQDRDLPNVVILDRHAWYDATIEAQALARHGVRVTVGWAHAKDRPAEVDGGVASDDEARRLSGISSTFVPPSVTTEARVVEMAKDADGVLVVRADIGARVMDALPRLKVIGRYGIGLDNVDVDAAAARGIAVVYAPGFCAREVADHTMAMLLACSRKLLPLHRALGGGVWGRDIASPMPALYVQTLGLVGFGQIGRAVAARAQAFGLRVVAFDPALDRADAARLGVESVGMDALLAQSDYVSLHLPLLASTKHLVDAAALAKMKPTAYVINTSRGPLIDEAALANALAAGRIGGAALDVFEREPLPADSPLLRLDNVLLSPHIGGLSDQGQVLLREQLASNVGAVLVRQWPQGPELFSPRGPEAQARARVATSSGRSA